MNFLFPRFGLSHSSARPKTNGHGKDILRSNLASQVAYCQFVAKFQFPLTRHNSTAPQGRNLSLALVTACQHLSFTALNNGEHFANYVN